MSQCIELLAALAKEQADAIEAWFAAQWAETEPFFYSSVDLRRAAYKLAPVDTNLFPAGFNNLSESAIRRAVHAAERTIEPGMRVLVVPEAHTRNLKYLDSLHVLVEILRAAGAEVVLGSPDSSLDEVMELTTASGHDILVHPLRRDGNRITTRDGFEPDMVLINNDMSDGRLDVLDGVEQRIMPPLGMGWYRRRKSAHFASFRRVATAFSEAFGVDDPWLIATEFHHCGVVNFMEMKGLECVALGVEKVLDRLKGHYARHGIEEEPFVFIKADSGTYGMGIMTVRSSEEVFEMNRKLRKKMHAIKGGVVNTDVVIQEGVPTADYVNGQTAEPMIYLVNGVPVGGAYRVHASRDARANLNAVGMSFTSLCDEGESVLALDQMQEQGPHCDLRVLGLVARLASLAAVREEYE